MVVSHSNSQKEANRSVYPFDQGWTPWNFASSLSHNDGMIVLSHYLHCVKSAAQSLDRANSCLLTLFSINIPLDSQLNFPYKQVEA